jgi:hypothetical protein
LDRLDERLGILHEKKKFVEQAVAQFGPAHKNMEHSSTIEKLPKDFRVHKELGKGSSNKVYDVTWDGARRILRAPRRRSETQFIGNAKWELLHTQVAAVLGVAPKLTAAWFSRHAHDEWPSGLYMVMDKYADDLNALLGDRKRYGLTAKLRDQIGCSLVAHLATLAKHGFFLYDLKPSNVLVAVEGDTVDVKVIDFGREFCEYRHDDIDARTPNMDYLTRMLQRDGVYSDALRDHLLFATMLVQLSATTTRHIYEDRHETRFSRGERENIHPTAALTATFLESMTGSNRAYLRRMLRADDVRGVLKHYLGRRNGGTRRSLRFAALAE